MKSEQRKNNIGKKFLKKTETVSQTQLIKKFYSTIYNYFVPCVHFRHLVIIFIPYMTFNYSITIFPKRIIPSILQYLKIFDRSKTLLSPIMLI